MTTNNSTNRVLAESLTRQPFTMRRLPLAVKLSSGLAMAGALTFSGLAAAQQSEIDEAAEQEDAQAALEEIVVRGQRSSIENALEIKRNADSIVDSIVADDIGKLPDRSIAEALQRVSGVTVSRFDDPGDPEHFAGEGAGVTIRGLPQVRADLNGREAFSAGGGRDLSFDDIPAELMAGVDVYKTPTADMIEGGLGGIVDLRTRMPFDSDGRLFSVTAEVNYADLVEEANGEFSALFSDRWETGIGEIGVLVDISTSDLESRSDNVLTRAFFPRIPGETGEFGEIEPDRTVWVPRGADWRRSDFERERDGQYLAVQWAPNEDAEIFLTAFRADAERTWLENAFFLDAGGGFDQFLPAKAEDDWVFNNNGALVSGTMTTVTNEGVEANGVPFGTSTRLSQNESETIDISTGFSWDATDRLSLSGSVQYIDSTAETLDNTLGLVAFPDEMRVENLNNDGEAPDIFIDPEFLSDFNNFSYGQMMQILEDNEADSVAARLDVEYDFESSIIQSVKAGVRYSDKSATNRGGNTWSARFQPWMVGPEAWRAASTTDGLPKIDDPQFVTNFTFDNFQNGGTNVPTTAVLVDPSLLSDFRGATDAIVAASPGGNSAPNFDLVDPNLPDNVNTQDEETKAAYVRVDFGFENWAMPLRGNLGVRVVETDTAATGQVSFPTLDVPTGEVDEEGNDITVQPFFQPDQSIEFENNFTHVLPSMNLSWHPSEQLIVRFSASQGIWRPGFDRMKALTSLDASFRDGVEQPETIDEFDASQVDFELTADGNPMLEPMEADQFDVTFEWYPQSGGIVYLSGFYKDVEDFFRTSTTRIPDFLGFNSVLSERPINTGTAEVTGFEVGFTRFFDNLPSPFDGLGIQGNYTYIDSSSDVPAEVAPVDTDGSTFSDMPLEQLSDQTYNLQLMYEKYGWTSRLAWNWRSEQLLSVGANGFNGSNNGIDWRLPVFEDDFGQLDFTLGYDISDQLSLNFEAYNLTRAETVGFFKQTGAGKHTAFVNTPDIRYSLSLRFTM